MLNIGSALKFCRVAEGRPICIRGSAPPWSGTPGRRRRVLEAAGGGVHVVDRGTAHLRQGGVAQPAFLRHGVRLTDVCADAGGIGRAAATLRDGGLVAFGTETVYGLGADADQRARGGVGLRRQGTAALQSADLPLPGCRGGLRRCRGEPARRTASPRRFWPGPLTLVLPRRATCPVALLAGAGLETLAVRVPAHPRPGAAAGSRAAGGGALGQPLRRGEPNHGGPCAGRAGRAASPRCWTAGRARSAWNRRVLDLTGAAPVPAAPGRGDPGGARGGGRPGRGIRRGGGGLAHVAVAGADGVALRAGLPVRLEARDGAAGRGAVGLRAAVAGSRRGVPVQRDGDLAGSGGRLFAGLRSLDAEGRGATSRASRPCRCREHGLGLAINDRLQRAAAPRE